MQEPLSNAGFADIHIHSNFSDGVASVKQILDHVEQNTKLDVIAITDHNTLKGSMLAASLGDRYSFEVIVGEEISTTSGEIIGLFIEKEIKKGLSVEKTIDLIHEQGGLAIAPHPFARPVSGIGGLGIGLNKVGTLDLDGYEEFNANPTTFYSNVLSKWLIKPLGILSRLGGSDAHTTHSIGAAATTFSGKTAGDLRKSILGRATSPIKLSSWIKEMLVSAIVAPGMASQARKYRNGLVDESAVGSLFSDAAPGAEQTS